MNQPEITHDPAASEGDDRRTPRFRNATARFATVADQDPLAALVGISAFLEQNAGDDHQAQIRERAEELDVATGEHDAEAAAERLEQTLQRTLGLSARGGISALHVHARVIRRRLPRPRAHAPGTAMTVRLTHALGDFPAGTTLAVGWGATRRPDRRAWWRLRPGGRVRLALFCADAEQFRAGRAIVANELRLVGRGVRDGADPAFAGLRRRNAAQALREHYLGGPRLADRALQQYRCEARVWVRPAIAVLALGRRRRGTRR